MTTATLTADPKAITGLGRDKLIEHIAELEREILEAESRAAKAAESERTMLGTLTSAQELATRSLNVARAVKAIGDDPIMQELAPLGAAILRARGLHPEGCALIDLVSEVGECATAMLREPPGERRAGDAT